MQIRTQIRVEFKCICQPGRDFVFEYALNRKFWQFFGACVICDHDTKQWPDFEVCDFKKRLSHI